VCRNRELVRGDAEDCSHNSVNNYPDLNKLRGKYLFGLGLALVGSFGVWYFSTLQREMANRLWPAFVFGALPMLVVGYVGRVVAAFLFMGAAGYGHFATMSYWEAEIVNHSIHPLTPLLVDRADVKELIGDWGTTHTPVPLSFFLSTHLDNRKQS
jgi:hypothetical protein